MKDKIIIYGYKNKYNYTIKQLKVDYNKKTYEVGSFTMMSDKNFKTRKEFYNKIEELNILDFKEVK